MTEDCLLVNENIQNITEFAVAMVGDTLTISFTADTVYGDIEFTDQVIARPEVEEGRQDVI